MTSPPESPFDEERQATDMIQVCMRQQNVVDGRGVKSKWRGIVFLQFAAALEHAAVDQNADAAGLQQMTGAGDGFRSAVKGQIHGESSLGSTRSVPRFSCHPKIPDQMLSAVSANQ